MTLRGHWGQRRQATGRPDPSPLCCGPPRQRCARLAFSSPLALLDGGKPEGISGGSMPDAYDEQQQQETRDLRTRIEKQDIQME